jgi:hypothetical protein
MLQKEGWEHPMTATERQSICSACKKPPSQDGRGFLLGTTGYCFSGRGWIVVPLSIALPVGAVFVSLVYLYDCFFMPSAVLIPLGSGWILAGATCWILGRIWNRDRTLHRFLGSKVETWGLFYFIPGVLMLLPILLVNLDTMTTCEPGTLRSVCGWIFALAAVGSVLLQLATLLIGLAFLLVWIPVYFINIVMSFKNQPSDKDSP